MRRHEGEVGIERIIPDRVDKVDRSICKKFAGVFARGDVIAAHALFLTRMQRVRAALNRAVVLAGWIKMIRRHIPVITHASKKYFISIGEAARISRFAVMPFSGAEGAVTVLLEHFAEEHMAVRNALTRIVEVIQRTPRVEHGAAWHADGATGAAGDVGVGKGRATLHQRINVGGLDDWVPQRSDRIEALVIGEKE